MREGDLGPLNLDGITHLDPLPLAFHSECSAGDDKLSLLRHHRCMTITLRDVTPADAAAIAAIYKPYVEESVATFEEVAPSVDEIAARIQATRDGGFPWLVAEEGGRVVAYAYAGPFHKRSAYRFTVENSVYVAPSHARRGIGTLLMREVIARCTARGYRQMIALISGYDGNPSIAMHNRLGFVDAAHLKAVGLKFGRWIDVVELQLELGEGNTSVPDTNAG